MLSSTNLSSSEVTRLRQNYSLSGFDLLERIQKMNYEELINTVIEIIKMNPPSKRKISDIICIKHALKDMPFFQQLIEEKGSDSTKQFFKNMLYSFYKKDEILFNQGDIVDRFYVLLSGKVSIIVNHTEIQINSKGEEQQIIITEEINMIESGHSIGDIALLRDQKRNSGIICKEDSHFLVLEKEDFNKIIADMEEREIQNKINFLKSLQIFESFSRRQLEISMIYLNKLKIRKGFQLCEEGKISSFIYIIIKGEFKVSKCINFERQVNPFSKAQLAQKDQIEQLKERKVKKALQIATLSEGEICCDSKQYKSFQFQSQNLNLKIVDALDDSPQLFTISCQSQKGEVFQIKTQHFFKRIVNEYYDKAEYKKIINDKINWRQIRLNNIQKITQGHLELLTGVYPKKNLIYYHADQEPIELVRRDTKQLDIYDKQQEIKQIKQRMSKYRRSTSGDQNLINELQCQNQQKTHFNGQQELKFLSSVRSRETTNSEQKQSIQSTNNNLFSPIQKQVKHQSYTYSPKIFSEKQNQICFQKYQEIQLKKNQNMQQIPNDQKNGLDLSSQDQNKKNKMKNYANLLCLLEQNKKQIDRNQNIIKQQNCNQKENKNFLIQDKQISQSEDMKNETNTEQNNQIFTNQKLQGQDAHKNTINLQNQIEQTNHQLNIPKKFIFLNKVQDQEKEENIYFKRVSSFKSSSIFSPSQSSLGDNQKSLEIEKSSEFLNKNQQVNNHKDLSLTYNRYKFLADGLAECPKQNDTNHMQFYKHNLIEDINQQSDNYQEFYQRNYILPKNIQQKNENHNFNTPTFQNNQIILPNKKNSTNDFQLMYSTQSQNKKQRNQLSEDFNSSKSFHSQKFNFHHQTASNSPQKCRTEESSSRKNSLQHTVKENLQKQAFIYSDEKDNNDSLNTETMHQAKQIENSNDIEVIEKKLLKKMQICREQEKQMQSNLKNYKTCVSNLAVSIEENKEINNSLMKLLKSKFGKNQQTVQTNDWRYNSSLIFTEENDMSYQLGNKKQQQMLIAKQRKEVSALKQKINQNQNGRLSLMSSPSQSRKRFSSSINYDDKMYSISKDQDIQNILDQIKEYNQQKFVNQIQKQQQIQNETQLQSINKNFNKYNFNELQNNQTLNTNSVCQQSNQTCENISTCSQKIQILERPQTTQNKLKEIIPNNTCNVIWRNSSQIKKQSASEGITISDQKDIGQVNQNYQQLKEDKELSMIGNGESFPLKNVQIAIKFYEIQSSKKQTLEEGQQTMNNQISLNDQQQLNRAELLNKILYEQQSNQDVVNNKKFIPYTTRQQTKQYSTIQSPIRPSRVVNIKVNFQGSTVKQKINQNFQELIKLNSPKKKQSSDHNNSLLKTNQKEDFSQEIKITSIKSIERSHEISQIEIWDSRNNNQNQEFNQTFYQYHSPLQLQRLLKK